jgi:ribA/ribD-fused uncharacterized protein
MDPPALLLDIRDKCSLIPGIEASLQKNSKQLSALIETVDFVSSKLEKACNEIIEVKKENAALRASNTAMKFEISKLKTDFLNIESQMRRNNLLFDGVPEKVGSGNGQTVESWQECEKSLIDLLKQHLGHVITGVDLIFDRVHRVGSKQRISQKPRQVIAKFALYKQRDLIWNNRFKLQGSSLWVSEDYPTVIRDNRKKLLPILQAAKRSKDVKSCALSLDKLYINNKLYTVDTINNVPESLKPENSSMITTDDTVVFSSKYAVLSNLHECKVKLGGHQFNSTEQYIQFSKAKLFKDEQCAEKILHEKDTFHQMMLGKKVKHFKSDVWDLHAKDILLQANSAKFTQNDYAKDVLMKTGTRLLGEATTNPVFGIGQSLNSRSVSDSSTWKGKNLMGTVLSEVRSQLC